MQSFLRAGQAISLEVNLAFCSLFSKSVLEEGTHLLCFVSLCISLLLWLQLQCLICNLSPIIIQSALMKAIESRIIVVTCCLVMLYRPRLPSWGLKSTTFTHAYWVPFALRCSKSNDVDDLKEKKLLHIVVLPFKPNIIHDDLVFHVCLGSNVI